MRAAAAAVAVAVGVRLAVVRSAVALASAITVQTGQDAGNEEEHTVHNAERERRLEHRARLVDVGVIVGHRSRAKGPEADVVGIAARDARAVGGRDEAQRVHGADEGADEEQVDHRHEGRVRRRAVVAEERVDGPREG